MGNIHSRDNATRATLLLDLSQVLAACIEKYAGWDRPVAASPLKRKTSDEEDNVTPPPKRVARDRVPVIRPGGKRKTQDKAMEPPAKKLELGLSRSIPVLPRPLRRHETMFTIPLSAPSVERFNKRKSGSDAGDPSKRKCPRVECYLWRLPNELLLLIIEELTADSLRLLSQVCTKLQDMAARSYFALLDFRTPDADGWLAVEDVQCEALPLWRRTNIFSVPEVVWFASSRCTNDRQFVLLRTFFESLKGLQDVRRVYLCLYGGPTEDSPAFQSLLQSIQASGCEELFCSGSRWVNAKPCMNGSGFHSRSRLRVLEINTPLLFASCSSSFTFAALRSAPLRRLTLTNTKLTPDNWTTLLQSLSLPQLSILAVDDTCPIHSLVDFLRRHPLHSLRVSHCTVTCTGFRPVRRYHSRTPLPFLSMLDGSPATLIALMRLIDVSSPFQRLTVRLNHLNDTQCLLPILLSCTEHFTDLQELQVTIPNHADVLSAYAEGDDLRTCSAKQVVLSVFPPVPHPDTIIHCAPWMRAFPRVNKLRLHTSSSRSDKELEDIFCAFSDDLCVKVLHV